MPPTSPTTFSCFNSRAHGGRDNACAPSVACWLFQFTRPRGARPTARLRPARQARGFNSRAHGGRDRRPPAGRRGAAGFNSRAHGGRDRLFRPRVRGHRVSIHAPTGGATRMLVAAMDAARRFQFTRPRGARLTSVVATARQYWFQFTRPRGARHSGSILADLAEEFQFTRPRGARPDGGRSRAGNQCFNSRAHGGRDNSALIGARLGFVSIHAPTGGATKSSSVIARSPLFQFTRPRGARHERGRGRRRQRPSFNSRAHGGRDLISAPLMCSPVVSIHAPTGGATRFRHLYAALDGFNSRAHGGRDLPRHRRKRNICGFQFTRPRGARPSRAGVYPGGRSFNSRAHGGRDVFLSFGLLGRKVSIHAPTGGATAC